MALSGTITYALTVGQLAERAHTKLGTLPQGGTLSGDEMVDAIAEMNAMFQTWSMEGPNLWTVADQSVSLVSGTQTYTLSPRPRLVFNARFLIDGVERLPLTEMPREDWDRFIYKTSPGAPTKYILDRQRASTTIKFWPLPTFSSGTWTVNVGYERIWQDVTDASQEIDIPAEWSETAIMCLAARLSEQYRINDPTVDVIRQRASALYDKAMAFDRNGDVTFVLRR